MLAVVQLAAGQAVEPVPMVVVVADAQVADAALAVVEAQVEVQTVAVAQAALAAMLVTKVAVALVTAMVAATSHLAQPLVLPAKLLKD